MSDYAVDAIQRVLFDTKTLQSKVAQLGAELSRDFEGKEVVLLGVLKGSFCFLADLARAMTIPVGVDFIAVSSYGSSTESAGMISITKDLSFDVRGKDLIIVEDIVDTGLTLHELVHFLQTKQPHSVSVVVLLDKPSRRKIQVGVDYTGFQIPDEFVVGYGLDFDERFRNLPYIGVLDPKEYS